MTELINEYLKTTKLLKTRIDEISNWLKDEKNLEKIKSLKIRKEYLEQERYDMLDVVTEMRGIISEEKIASGDC